MSDRIVFKIKEPFQCISYKKNTESLETADAEKVSFFTYKDIKMSIESGWLILWIKSHGNSICPGMFKNSFLKALFSFIFLYFW